MFTTDGTLESQPVPQPGAMPQSARNRLLLSTILGTTIEFFDVYIYGLAAALYFAHLFFPNSSPTMGVIASFGTLASGFLVRPIGGIVGGHFGDRYGRKSVLVASMVIMGVSTFAVGFLPTYKTIGLWAPILLIVVRLLQGLGAGAEWGGGVLMLVEHLGKDRRGLWGSFANFGIWLAIVIGTLIFVGITRLPEETQNWIWRIPFLASAGLVMVGLWIRMGVSETPYFLKIEQTSNSGQRNRLPITELFRTHKKATLIAISIAASTTTFQLYNAFAASYGKSLHLPISTILQFQLANSVIGLLLTVFFGWLSDKTGRRSLAILGSIIVVPCLYLLFWSLNHAQLPLVMTSLALLEFGHSMIYGPMGAFLSELFDTRTRCTGVSLGYQIGGGAISGLGPLVASSILAGAGGPPHVYGVPLIAVVISSLTIVGACMAPEMAGRELPE
jgi:MFS transporter, MHS family, shikimate and dehydroshikimate transport protein